MLGFGVGFRFRFGLWKKLTDEVKILTSHLFTTCS